MCRFLSVAISAAIVVVAHFVCIKLITAWHAMLTMRAIETEKERESQGAVGVPTEPASHTEMPKL